MQLVSIMVESIGRKLAQARLARGLTLEEAAMETRIRARQLGALEADDYSSFANNTYARGFLLMYGKFLNVDVRAFARELEAGNPISLSDYQYLNAPEGEPERAVRRAAPEVRRNERRRPSLAPLIAFILLMAMVGFGAHLYYQAQRLEVGMSSAPATPTPEATATAPGAPASAKVETKPETAVPPVISQPVPAGAAPIAPTPQAPIQTTNPSPVVPVQTDHQFLSTSATPAPAPTTLPPVEVSGSLTAPLNELVIEPLKKTWVRVRRDDPAAEPVFEDVVYPKVGPLKLKGNRFWVEVKDADAVMLRKNGQPLAYQPPGITIQ
ncbi:MAG TPA: helix-turn-helix domain-containing protein [Chthoniobacteraceae bacterium]|nr:helix-turn-helix domain-containing protein [Chthoniobacteraceae bacterium]